MKDTTSCSQAAAPTRRHSSCGGLKQRPLDFMTPFAYFVPKSSLFPLEYGGGGTFLQLSGLPGAADGAGV